MSIGLLIVLSVIGYIALLIVAVTCMIQVVKPPKSVRIAAMAETAFGTMVFGTSLYIFGPEHPLKMRLLFIMLGLFWIGVAVSLNKASRMGRALCLFLSIVRIPTIIGIFFSLFSVYELYFKREASDFFKEAGRRRADHSPDNDSSFLGRQE